MLEYQNWDAKYHRLAKSVSIIYLSNFIFVVFEIFSLLWIKLAHRHHRVFSANDCVTHHQQKDFMVLDSYASANPWAMVIHPENTFATKRAMMCPWRLDLLACLAVPINYQFLYVHDVRKIAILFPYSSLKLFASSHEPLILLSSRWIDKCL